MRSLLPPNSTAAERNYEIATARLSAVPMPTREIIDPDTCPKALLPWLAWALSVDSWKSYWPLSVKRARLREAIEIQRRKGTANSVRAVVQAFGGAVEVIEWWQETPRAAPHTFQLVLVLGAETASEETSAQYVDDVIAEVNRTKPVRSHFYFTQGVAATAVIRVMGAARVVNYRRLQFEAS